ncbi:MAG: hypothetical protein QG637_1640 [Chloroflexota bacterium]|nr:hypothetical protein [Chloroflexota bacterium]
MTAVRLRTQLRQLLDERFSDGELRTLCCDLDVDYDDLPGSGKADKARELVSYMARRGSLSKLVRVGQQSRPDAPWPAIEAERAQPSQPTSVKTTTPAIQARRDINNSGTIIVGNIQGNVIMGRPGGNT